MTRNPVVVDVLVVGAGPAGSAAAIYATQAGHDVLLVEAASFPRDKTCGDGLTPRAVHQLERLGLSEKITNEHVNHGLKLHGFGGSVTAPWPKSAFGTIGSAMPRMLFDALLADAAVSSGATLWEDARATSVETTDAGVQQVTVIHAGVEKQLRPRWVIVADGVRSNFGKLLGRQWHRGEVYGIAARSYCTTPRADEQWIHSHLELKDPDGVVQPGYGWIFPLGDGRVNLGVGALSTDKRPAKVNTKRLLSHYASQQRSDWQLGPETDVASALLPMGGAVSGVSGPNWLLIGDAAACVNPLNGEGIDYGLETAEMAVAAIGTNENLTTLWPQLLRESYGEAFLLARTAARLLTYPKFLPLAGPLGLRGPIGARLMPAAARLMGNLVTDQDRDLVARAWRGAGGAASWIRRDSPLWSNPA
ncbi:geranylgeranyl reductase family protein [Corynebacterium alimapuense]|uniref:geranylgeranyl reductase family protein n=1 Tax=Corynebacterium alimapuense TaxID=1576874 RepID=UPI0014032C58|nr:geranylgeranyl reductase family protein [Corynebacterium alimapuense]